jgi:ribonuclease-3
LLPVEKLPVFPLPPPPPISDPKILRQVFTHQSLFPHSRGSFEDAEAGGQGHYEKLEHVGDSILGMVVTTWLHELKPGLKCGTATVSVVWRKASLVSYQDSSWHLSVSLDGSDGTPLTSQKLKAHLVSNATLSHISGMYNFPQRLNGDARLLPVLRAQTDVRAALVEAYIAGVYFSFPANERLTYGMAAVTTWLRELYGPLYDFFLQHMRREYAQHYSVLGTAYDGTVAVAASPEELDRLDAAAEGMALLVKMYAAQRSRTVTYDVERYETSVGVLWRMRCALDGVEMGDATRSSRYRARNAAAWEAAKKLGLTAGAEL